MTIEFLDTDFEKISYLVSVIKASVTGGEANNNEFKQLRLDVLSNSEISQHLPSWLKITRDLGALWDYIQPKFPTYRERRVFIDQEFAPLLNYLELGTKDSSIDLIKNSLNLNSPARKSNPAPAPAPYDKKEYSKPNTAPNKKIFIVHGRDNETKQEVARFVDSLGLKSIILHEQASRSMTILQKIDHYTSDVGFALVLYTPCDLGKGLIEHNSNKPAKPRARQNVVFEHGYLIAKLGEDKVMPLLKSEEIEIPNDISGMVYSNLDSSGGWKLEVIRELEAAGYTLQ